MRRFLYTFALFLLLPVTLVYLLWRARRQPAYLQHWGERFGLFRQRESQHPLLWIHAISVGETRAAQPLVTALRAQWPDYSVLLTHMTPTGRETGQQMFGDSVEQSYLPYDFPFAVAAFLERFQPRVGILMETEIWPNLIHAAHRRNIPMLLVNARLSPKSARRYSHVARLTREALAGLSAIAAQSSADAEALRALGAKRIEVTGNMKFDAETPATALRDGKTLRDAIGQRQVWVAASTREGEEELLLTALPQLQTSLALLILVPRHPQRFDEVARLIDRCGLVYQRRSSQQAIAPETRVLLGDTMGELSTYYAASDIAFVGGSLKPFGGQNLIEACALGKPVLFGRYTYNFAAAAQAALDGGAAMRVDNASELMGELDRLFRDAELRARMGAAALKFSTLHRGATNKTLVLIGQALQPGNTAAKRDEA